MDTEILKALSSKYSIIIDKNTVRNIRTMTIKFETYKDHPLVLNTGLLGINKIVFSKYNKTELFDIFDKDEAELKYIISTISTIDTSRIVTSDPFNIFVTWILHNIVNSKLSQKDQYNTSKHLLMFWQYKFFSSAVNQYYRYGANYDIMQNVFESLSLKSDIRRLESWRRVMIERAEHILDEKSIHIKHIRDYTPDSEILYLISNTQTKLRNQLVKINIKYYEYKATMDHIGSTSATVTIDGKMLLKEHTSNYELMSTSITSKLIASNDIVGEHYVDALLKMFKELSKTLVLRLLREIGDMAKDQKMKRTLHKVRVDKNRLNVYVGIDALVSNILSSVYKFNIDERVDLRNKMAIFSKAKSLYTTHRPNHLVVNSVKETLFGIIAKNNISKRRSTTGMLVIFVVLYFTIMSFEYLEKK